MNGSVKYLVAVQKFETSISSKQRDVCHPKVRHTKPAIPRDRNLHDVMMYHDVPRTTCFTRLAPYPASAKALKVPDQRSKPGNPRRKKKL